MTWYSVTPHLGYYKRSRQFGEYTILPVLSIHRNWYYSQSLIPLKVVSQFRLGPISFSGLVFTLCIRVLGWRDTPNYTIEFWGFDVHLRTTPPLSPGVAALHKA